MAESLTQVIRSKYASVAKSGLSGIGNGEQLAGQRPLPSSRNRCVPKATGVCPWLRQCRGDRELHAQMFHPSDARH